QRDADRGAFQVRRHHALRLARSSLPACAVESGARARWWQDPQVRRRLRGIRERDRAGSSGRAHVVPFARGAAARSRDRLCYYFRMGQAAVSPLVPLEEYFEAEVNCAHDAPKHEWSDGVVYAMSRGTPEHGRLIASMTA